MSDKEPAKVVHINKWDEFKTLANALRPSSIAYAPQKAPLSKPPIGLRLVFAVENVQYVFIDCAEGSALRRTKIPVYVDEAGIADLNDEDVKKFIATQLERTDLSIISFGALGY